MNIVQVSVGSVRIPPKEGSAPLQVMFNTSRHLARMGHRVIILDRKYSKQDPDIEEIEGVEVVRLKAIRLPVCARPAILHFIIAELNAVFFALSVSRYLKKHDSNIDVIHVHVTSVGLVIAVMNSKLREKLYYTCHLGQWIQEKGKLSTYEKIHLFLDPKLMKRVRKVIALNKSAQHKFISVSDIDNSRVVVIPNGVDTQFFRPDMQSGENVRIKHGLVGRSIILYVGRLARLKGVDYLLKAVDMLVNQSGQRNAAFVLVGSPSFDATEQPIDIPEALGFIKRYNLQDHVLLTGSLHYKEVREWYQACDIFVLPSLAEGDPLVTLEAMASGLPIIGTRVGGIPNQIRDGWNGFLIEPGDEKQLAERIGYLLDNKEERARMAANSRQLAEEEFDWSRVAERLLLAYSDD